MTITGAEVAGKRAEHLAEIESQRRRVALIEARLDEARQHLDWLERMRATFEDSVEVAIARGLVDDYSCRGCSSSGVADRGHVYGVRKCCPGCDHRPLEVVAAVEEIAAALSGEVRCTWCGRVELAGERHRLMPGVLDSGEPSDFVCLDVAGRPVVHLPGPDAGGPAPF